ncbi:MAG: hypothetical protein GC182_13955 [Rhodopseudomonas sp.]|nr:hypothetical protein [Rhodopseudomonas sp.]
MVVLGAARAIAGATLLQRLWYDGGVNLGIRRQLTSGHANFDVISGSQPRERHDTYTQIPVGMVAPAIRRWNNRFHYSYPSLDVMVHSPAKDNAKGLTVSTRTIAGGFCFKSGDGDE